MKFTKTSVQSVESIIFAEYCKLQIAFSNNFQISCFIYSFLCYINFIITYTIIVSPSLSMRRPLHRQGRGGGSLDNSHRLLLRCVAGGSQDVEEDDGRR